MEKPPLMQDDADSQPVSSQPSPSQPFAIANDGRSYSTAINATEAKTAPASEEVADHLLLSVVSTFFCMVLGILAIVKASDAKISFIQGDITAAKRSSQSARRLAISAIVAGVLIVVLLLLVAFLLVVLDV